MIILIYMIYMIKQDSLQFCFCQIVSSECMTFWDTVRPYDNKSMVNEIKPGELILTVDNLFK